MFRKYYPAELDPKLAPRVKAMMMEDWVRENLDAIVRDRIHPHVLANIINSSHLVMRNNFDKFVQLSSSFGLPYYIISGGI